jgi:hypothetical protein
VLHTHIAPSPTLFIINLSLLLLLLVGSPTTPNTLLSFLTLDNLTIGKASSINIPSLPIADFHSTLLLSFSSSSFISSSIAE